MKDALLIFLGGGAGSLLRFYVGKWANPLHPFAFPVGTLVANVLACLALGIIIGLAEHKSFISPGARQFWAVGFCGGFSTFSTFSNETLNLLQSGFTLMSAAYVVASLLLCVVAVYAGIHVGHHL